MRWRWGPELGAQRIGSPWTNTQWQGASGAGVACKDLYPVMASIHAFWVQDACGRNGCHRWAAGLRAHACWVSLWSRIASHPCSTHTSPTQFIEVFPLCRSPAAALRIICPLYSFLLFWGTIEYPWIIQWDNADLWRSVVDKTGPSAGGWSFLSPVQRTSRGRGKMCPVISNGALNGEEAAPGPQISVNLWGKEVVWGNYWFS